MNNTRLRAASTIALISSVAASSCLLDASAKKIVIDSLSALAEPSPVDREIAKSSRHSFRAAVAWLRQQPGRLMLRAVENARRPPRPGVFQAKRPKAEPFRPGYGRAPLTA